MAVATEPGGRLRHHGTREELCDAECARDKEHEPPLGRRGEAETKRLCDHDTEDNPELSEDAWAEA